MLKSLGKYATFMGGSALGAVVDYVVTLGAVHLLGIPAGVALGLAMLFSASLVFFWHDHVTFGAARRPGRGRRYAAFMVWSGVVFALRAGILAALRAAGAPLSLALALAILVASVINYVLSSRVIFRPGRS